MGRDTRDRLGVECLVIAHQHVQREPELLSDLAWHAGIYLPAMLLALAFIPTVTLPRLIGQDSTPLPSSSDGLSLASIAPGALRVWTIIFVIDVIWTAYDVAFRAAPQRSRE